MSEVDEDGDPDAQDRCNQCLADAHCDGTVSWCNCTCGWGDDERDDDPEDDGYQFSYDGYRGDWYRPEVVQTKVTTDDGEPVL